MLTGNQLLLVTVTLRWTHVDGLKVIMISGTGSETLEAHLVNTLVQVEMQTLVQVNHHFIYICELR